MKPESGNTESAWTSTAEVPSFPKLAANVETDVCIVGAGIAGLSTAYMLTKAGKKVVVIDDGPICGGETQRTTAHLTNVFDDRYDNVIKEHGKEQAKLLYDAHTAAINMIEANIRAEQLDCEFSRLDGFLFDGDNHKTKILDKEFDALKEVGFDDVQMLDSIPLKFFPEPRKAIRCPRQGQFHVLKYLRGLVRAITAGGAQIFSGTHMTEIAEGDIVTVKTGDGFTIRCSAAVVATNTPVTDWVKVHTKQAAYRTYVVAHPVPKDYVPLGLYWDTEDPYHYIRLEPIENDPDNMLLIIGGEDHKTGQEEHPEHCFDTLEKWSRKMFPILSDVGTFQYRWSGQVMEPVDGIAFIGKDPAFHKNVYIATGDSGQGMTHGTIAGMLISDLIMGVDNPWTTVFDPSRKPLKAAVDYIKENANVAMQYADYLKPGDVKSVNEIPKGCGSVMHHKGHPIAVYKSESGEVTQCSAICPHLRAILTWNDVEKSWDCPAHGSRFKATGEVINGPANSNMSPVPPEQQVKEDPLEDTTQLPKLPPGDSGIQPPPPIM